MTKITLEARAKLFERWGDTRAAEIVRRLAGEVGTVRFAAACRVLFRPGHRHLRL